MSVDKAGEVWQFSTDGMKDAQGEEGRQGHGLLRRDREEDRDEVASRRLAGPPRCALEIRATRKAQATAPPAGDVDDGIPAHPTVEAEVPGGVEEAQREVARPRVGAPPRAGRARAAACRGGAPERPSARALLRAWAIWASHRAGSRFPAEQDPCPARSHVRLDQEPRPRAPCELRQVHAAARRILRPPSPENARPRHGPAEKPALGRREEARRPPGARRTRGDPSG